MASRMMLAKLEDYWLGLRLREIEIPAAHLLKSQATINLSSNLYAEALVVTARAVTASYFYTLCMPLNISVWTQIN